MFNQTKSSKSFLCKSYCRVESTFSPSLQWLRLPKSLSNLLFTHRISSFSAPRTFFRNNFIGRRFSSQLQAQKGASGAENEHIEAEEASLAQSSGFYQFNLRPALIKGLSEQFKITNPTQIQRLALNTLLKTRPIDPSTANYKPVFLAAQTGTGKSLAFLLPLIELLKRDEEVTENPNNLARIGRPRAIILTPNRELTQQLLYVCKQLSHYGKFRSEAVAGGEMKKKQLREIDRAVDILIATPGRMQQLLEEGIIRLTDCAYVVIDEADTMFTEQNGFLPLLRQILKPIRERLILAQQNQQQNKPNNPANQKHGSKYANETPCQFILSSASIPRIIEPVISQEFPGTIKLNSTELHKLPQQLTQRFVTVGNQNKLYVLLELLRQEQAEFQKNNSNKGNIVPIDHKEPIVPSKKPSNPLNQPGNSEHNSSIAPTLPPTLIFCNTVVSCVALDYFLRENNIPAVSYHGEISASQRSANFRSFLLGQSAVMLCTDLASRGLDTRGVGHIIQFDMALNPIDYLHRVGRTARIGNMGKSTALVTRGDRVLAKAIKEAFESNGPINNLSSDKKDYEQSVDTSGIPSILRNANKIRPLYKKLGINPATVDNSQLNKQIKSHRTGELPTTARRVYKSQERWARYKTAEHVLREDIEGSIAKEKRLYEDRANFRLRVAKLSRNEVNKMQKTKSSKNDRDRIDRTKVREYYNKMGLGKKKSQK
jgi:superfamily II DNA/RNA helicase